MVFPENSNPNGETPPPFFQEEPRPGPVPPPPFYRQPPQPEAPAPTNAMGLTGFILSLVTLIGWAFPFAGFITWILGLIFSCIGMTKRPRGFAVAGLIISLLIGLFFLLLFFFAFALFSTIITEPF